MAEVRWTAEVERWLRDIYDYIAQDDAEAAARVVEGILSRAETLQQFAALGYLYDEADKREVRILLYGHYRIAYLVKANKDVDILGVFHGALDINRYLL